MSVLVSYLQKKAFDASGIIYLKSIQRYFYIRTPEKFGKKLIVKMDQCDLRGKVEVFVLRS